MEQTPLQFLLRHGEKKAISFHMPGHKGSAFYRDLGYGDFLESFMDCDITEIPGADNLFQTEGILKTAQDRYAGLYGVTSAYLLINGTSGGIIAAILAAVERGGKLIMARNCHKSVFNALMLGDITPVYLHPEMNEEHGVLGGISPEEIETAIKNNPDAAAVILPSPNYYGICSDITSIAEVVHRYGKVLIVDQAHGAHIKWLKKRQGKTYPMCAEDCNADIVINSIHKTLGSLTQSAVLNYKTSAVTQHDLEDKLQAVQSTSPSYILMASLDINADILEKHEKLLFDRWSENLKWTYEQIRGIPEIQVIEGLELFDCSKINIDTTALDISANQLENFLIERNIFAELTTGNILMFMTGIGNKRSDYEDLVAALKEAAAFFREKTGGLPADEKDRPPMPGKAVLAGIPREKHFVPLEEAAGAVAAAMIIPYPPGIPILCPGEKIEKEMMDYVLHLRKMGEKVIGVDENGKILVGKS